MSKVATASRIASPTAQGKKPKIGSKKTLSALPPVLTAAGILALWQISIPLFGIPTYIAPAPSEVIIEFYNQFYFILGNLWPTLLEAIAGFVFGNLVGVVLAVILVHNSTVERCVYPILVFFHSIPILALAPILVLIFGTGIAPKIIIASLLCFFTMLVNMVRGLTAVSAPELELMKVLSATRSEIFWKLRLQRSLPFMFSALKIAAPACVIGAIVGEWIGSSVGLGALILDATYNFRSPLLYATIFLSSGLAIGLFSVVSVAERRIIYWTNEETR